MSTRERAYSIFRQLNEEQLKGFIAMFGQFYTIKLKAGEPSEKRRAFEELNQMIRPIPDLDEKKELEEKRV